MARYLEVTNKNDILRYGPFAVVHHNFKQPVSAILVGELHINSQIYKATEKAFTLYPAHVDAIGLFGIEMVFMLDEHILKINTNGTNYDVPNGFRGFVVTDLRGVVFQIDNGEPFTATIKKYEEEMLCTREIPSSIPVTTMAV